VDGLKQVLASLVKLNKTKEIYLIEQNAKAKYPKLSNQLDEVIGDVEFHELWQKGTEFIHSPQKDFVYGQKLFLQIVSLKPSDYWANLLTGGCHTWGGKAKEGEPWIRKAIQIDASIPNGYALLAQNLLWQSRSKEVIVVVEEMMKQFFPTVAQNKDHADKIVEALDCAVKVLGRGNEYKALLGVAKAKYPSIVQRLDKI